MKQNQITLDKTKAYNISELDEEQIKQIAKATGDCLETYLKIFQNYPLHYTNTWVLAIFGNEKVRESKQIINAKTLFN